MKNDTVEFLKELGYKQGDTFSFGLVSELLEMYRQNRLNLELLRKVEKGKNYFLTLKRGNIDAETLREDAHDLERKFRVNFNAGIGIYIHPDKLEYAFNDEKGMNHLGWFRKEDGK